MSEPTFELAAACAFGLEAIVKRELEGLGIQAQISDSGRVHFSGTYETIGLANLWLRTADRILIRVADFPARDFDALFETTRNLNWATHIPIDGQFPVTGRCIQSQLSSVPACQRSVKRAIVDSLQRDHATSELSETGTLYKVDVAIIKDHASLTIDTTGRSLHRRGYRKLISSAPLKETLAAAMVMLSFWRNGKPLLDPFCGSGTIPIEAALIGRKIAPGINREFQFETWQTAHQDTMKDLRATARAGELAMLDAHERLKGSDIDPNVLRAARENAELAGVTQDVHFQPGDALQITSKRRFGCLITNPPYGERIGRDRDLDQLYEGLPEVLRKLPTWSHYILTAYRGLERTVGRKADRRRKLYNGRIECTYFQFFGPKPVVEEREKQEKPLVHASGEAAFGQLGEKAAHQAELFSTRLRKRAKHLRRWPTKRNITCFRLYERDIPEIPLVVDRYEDRLHIVEYERPHDRAPAEHGNWLDLMAQTAGQALDVPPHHVYMKRRGRQRGTSQHEKLGNQNERFVVHEGGLKFLVNLADYADTGLFLDHRVTRSMVRDLAKDKSFLNLFAYTGSFTTYAVDGGAAESISVDLSKSYLDWARDNLALNGLDGKQHRFITKDVVDFIRRHPAGPKYDLVMFDPPTFSNSKRTEQDWKVQTDAIPLLNQVLQLVKPGGLVFFSNNFRRFRFDPEQVDASEIHEISRQTVPEDFRNRRIHRCWRVVR